jgi:small subunit ribosomal protein S9
MNSTIQYYGTGKRKTARARVFLRPGTGAISINGRTFEDYFPNALHRMTARSAFVVTETAASFDVYATCGGGGVSAQAEAVRHGISRALLRHDAALRKPLKKAGFLTRDAREVERKIYGQPGSRKRFQFSKR